MPTFNIFSGKLSQVDCYTGYGPPTFLILEDT